MKYLYYPGHGVCKVTGMEHHGIRGRKAQYITMECLNTGMKLIMPKKDVPRLTRPLMSRETMFDVLYMLAFPVKGTTKSDATWNMRYRQFMENIRSGDPIKVAQTFCNISILKAEKDLSFGEKKMLDLCLSLLHTEIVCALDEEGAK